MSTRNIYRFYGELTKLTFNYHQIHMYAFLVCFFVEITIKCLNFGTSNYFIVNT